VWEDIWASEGESSRRLEKKTMTRNSVICTSRQIGRPIRRTFISIKGWESMPCTWKSNEMRIRVLMGKDEGKIC
jgi:hypothetical protein